MRAASKNKIPTKIITIIIVLMLLWAQTALAEQEMEKGYYTVYEEGTNKKIFSTARVVSIGDQYLNEQNILYEIVKVSGNKAYAKFKEEVDIEQALELPESQVTSEIFQDKQDTLKTSGEKKEKVVAIYHTHSDESYIPTDGKASIPYKGGIFKVGSALKTALEKKGIKVIQSYQPHDPHDSMAYQRSRRTATELLKNAPDAIIDIHRDGVPAEEYQGQVKGQTIAKMQLVVGRQNPQLNTIDNFAKQIKATADKKYPGLIKGIFYGKGGFNQDLYPRSILIEAGTYTNSRYKAQDGANILADVIATTLYGEDYEKEIDLSGRKTTEVPKEGSNTFKTLLWVIGLIIVGFGGYMLISTGGINELSAKLKSFSSIKSTLNEKKKDNDNE